MPTTRGEPVADRDALQTGGQVPDQPDVEAAAVEERIDDQVPGVARDLGGRRQRRARLRHRDLPDQQHEREHDERRHDAARRRRRTRVARRRRSGSSASASQRQHLGRWRRRQTRSRGLGLHERHVHRIDVSGVEHGRATAAISADFDALDRQALEVGARIVGIEHLAVEEGLLAARGRRRDLGRPARRAPWPPRATGPRG